MPNLPKPEPYTPNIKKSTPSELMKSMGPNPTKYTGSLKKLPPGVLKTILDILLKGGGAPRGESPMPYSRFGQPMD